MRSKKPQISKKSINTSYVSEFEKTSNTSFKLVTRTQKQKLSPIVSLINNNLNDILMKKTMTNSFKEQPVALDKNDNIRDNFDLHDNYDCECQNYNNTPTCDESNSHNRQNSMACQKNNTSTRSALPSKIKFNTPSPKIKLTTPNIVRSNDKLKRSTKTKYNLSSSSQDIDYDLSSLSSIIQQPSSELTSFDTCSCISNEQQNITHKIKNSETSIQIPCQEHFQKNKHHDHGHTGPTGPCGTIIKCGEIILYGMSAHNDAAKVNVMGTTGDICLTLDSGVLYEWNGTTWQIAQPQPSLPYYYYATDTLKLWYVTQLGIPPIDVICKTPWQGNIFLDTLTSNLYVETPCGWELKCDLRGATGPTGPTMYINSSIIGVTGNTNSTNYTEIYDLLGPSTITANLISVDIAIQGDTNGTASLQLVDTTNIQTLATLISTSVSASQSIVNLGTISNQAASVANWTLNAKIDSSLTTLEVLNMILTYSK